METFPWQLTSPRKASSFVTMSMMTTKTISLAEQVANLATVIEGLSTSLKVNNQEIVKLMNKLESINEGGQTLVIKVL